jgi:hypothetical protein
MTPIAAQSSKSGFEATMNRRAAVQHWSYLSKLSQFGSNREATSIVASFQQQMEFELNASQTSLTTERAA